MLADCSEIDRQNFKKPYYCWYQKSANELLLLEPCKNDVCPVLDVEDRFS